VKEYRISVLSSLSDLLDGLFRKAILKLRLVFSSWLSTAFYPSRAGTLFFCERNFQMAQGTIKKLIADKGFGFIEGEKGDLFFHHSAVEGATIETLQVGQEVSYEEGEGPKGPRAENVRPM
tara:strand:+ start:266 stop:628 length:363 start_codon:yes stop_codon:yes gene_type:complete